MNDSIKALASEVAERHDEVCGLKKKMSDIESEVHRMHMKLQLKENVIRELRNDLRQANSKVSKVNLFLLILQCMKYFYIGKRSQPSIQHS